MSGSESPVANGYDTHVSDGKPPSPGASPLDDVNGEDGDLFGDVDDNEQDDSLNRKLDDAELDSGDDEGRDDRRARSLEGYDEDEPAFSEAANLQMEIARINALKSDELYIVTIPPFLGLQAENFDYKRYEPPTRPHDDTDPTDKFSAYSTATTTLMWRRDPQDPSKMQSNSRIIRWSDGSLTLQIASRPKDQYRISTKPYRQGFGTSNAQKSAALSNYDPSKDSHVYLAAAHSAVEALQIVAPVDAQLRILPTGDLSDQSIQMLQQSLAASQVIHDPLASLKQLKEDPEIARKAAELFEKDRLRSLRKRENAEDKLLTKRDRVLGRSGLGRSGGLSVAGLEADEDGMPRSSAFKSKQAKRRGNRRGDIYSDDEDEDLPRGRTREDEYDLDDGFMAGSDEEIETYEDESVEEQDPDVDDLEIEGRKTVIKEKTRGGMRSPSPQKRPAEDDGAGEGSPGQARKKRTRIIDDDDDDE